MADEHPDRLVEALFAEYLNRRDQGEEVDFDAFCAEHPEQGEELRRLHEEWQRLRFSQSTSTHPQETVHVVDEQTDPEAWRAFLARLEKKRAESGRYQFRGDVAHGGMGAIVRVYDEDLRRNLAMKVILGKYEAAAAGDTPAVPPKVLGRFLEEAQVTAQLDHPGIVPVHELGVDQEGKVFFTMKLVKGDDLRVIFDKVKTGEDGWNQTRALNTILRAAEAMAFAHDRGVIHRDLKPANIMVGRFGEVYVMDWGLGRVLGQKDTKDLRLKEAPVSSGSIVRSDRKDSDTPDSPLVTMDGDVVGTPAYMSPEQAEGHLSVLGPHSDVYGMGAVIYQLITGRMPYTVPGKNMSGRTILAQVLHGSPESISRLNPKTPAELISICEKAMAREIPDRYRTMVDLASDIRAYLEDRVVSAYASGAIAELKKWVKRNRGITVTAVSAALLVAALTGWFILNIQAQKDRADDNANLAEERAQEAERERNAAREERDRADQKTKELERLSDGKTLRDLRARVDDLWPAQPEKVDAMRTWLSEAGELTKRMPLHRETLRELRTRGTAAAHPRDEELARLVKRRESLDSLRGALRPGGVIAELDSRIAHLGATIERERLHEFSNQKDSWWHESLVSLVSDLTDFTSDDENSATVASVRKRLEFAESIHRRSITDQRAAWDEARASIANPEECPAYDGMAIREQLGLVPIGRDPKSGLWEFWHVQTGEKPERDEDGNLVLAAGMGLVFVLIPEGTFWMGAQKADPDGHNYDLQATLQESYNGAPMEVALDAYFLSKYEMTQGQWERFVGKNPSSYGPETGEGFNATRLHPVELVSWEDCRRELSRLGLLLPTEAQWEYACRARTETPWWTGREKGDLDEAGNLADRTVKEHSQPSNWPIEEDLNDGSAIHAPVGRYGANAFGLYDVIGNVAEWCLDGYGGYRNAPTAGDGEREVPDASRRMVRGGDFQSDAASARSAYRVSGAAGNRDPYTGVRPARDLTSE